MTALRSRAAFNSIKSILIVSLASLSFSLYAQTQVCGKYQSTKSSTRVFIKTNNTLAFLDDNAVTERNYTIQKDQIEVQGGLKFKIVSDSKIIASNATGKGETYIRTQAAKNKCDPKTKLDPFCFTKARQFRIRGNLKGASNAYEKCCDAGDGTSCNANATLHQMSFKNDKLANVYFNEACDLGFYGGCSNLAIIAMNNNDKQRAIKFYKIACNLKDPDSCRQLFKLNQVNK